MTAIVVVIVIVIMKIINVARSILHFACMFLYVFICLFLTCISLCLTLVRAQYWCFLRGWASHRPSCRCPPWNCWSTCRRWIQWWRSHWTGPGSTGSRWVRCRGAQWPVWWTASPLGTCPRRRRLLTSQPEMQCPYIHILPARNKANMYVSGEGTVGFKLPARSSLADTRDVQKQLLGSKYVLWPSAGFGWSLCPSQKYEVAYDFPVLHIPFKTFGC